MIIILGIIYLLKILLTPSVANYDNLMFVQVWPAAWIHNNSQKYNFTNDYFTIHGIWPERSDGSWPEYCDKTAHLNFTKINYMKKYFDKYWTNFDNSTNFLEHEFTKHLTCVKNNPYKYFQLGLEARKEMDLYERLKKYNIIPNNTYYKTDIIRTVLEKELGESPIITCDNSFSILTEIIFCTNDDLKIIKCSEKERKSDCTREYVKYTKI